MKHNTPDLWRSYLPSILLNGHKYMRGHVVIFGGARMTGAARLAAGAAMRSGAGVCTIVAPPQAFEIYRLVEPHILVEPLLNENNFTPHFDDKNRQSSIIGPGIGLDNKGAFKNLILSALAVKKPIVLDADALNVFENDALTLFNALHPACVLTPHEGEFLRLFGIIEGTKEARVKTAAKIAGANVLLKGAETVIASPDGRCIVNTHASPYLATAGSGDVLAGIIGGLMAQGMEPFYAACAGAWIHGDAGMRVGIGLIAPDIIAQIPIILKAIVSSVGNHNQDNGKNFK